MLIISFQKSWGVSLGVKGGGGRCFACFVEVGRGAARGECGRGAARGEYGRGAARGECGDSIESFCQRGRSA